MSFLKNNPEWFAIIGVIVGFSLSIISQYVHYRFRIRRMKKIIVDELKVIKSQLRDFRGIINQIIGALSQNQLLPGNAVGVMNVGYNKFFEDVYEHLSLEERNCLFYIHRTLVVGQETMNAFAQEFQEVVKNKVLENPHAAYITKFRDLLVAYDTVEQMIDSYIAREPINVLEPIPS